VISRQYQAPRGELETALAASTRLEQVEVAIPQTTIPSLGKRRRI